MSNKAPPERGQESGSSWLRSYRQRINPRLRRLLAGRLSDPRGRRLERTLPPGPLCRRSKRCVRKRPRQISWPNHLGNEVNRRAQLGMFPNGEERPHPVMYHRKRGIVAGILFLAVALTPGAIVAGPFEDGKDVALNGDYATAIRLWQRRAQPSRRTTSMPWDGALPWR